RRSKRLAALTTLALGLGALVTAPPAVAATRKVTVFDNFFQPGRRVVQKGTRVRWVNQGDDRHSTTSVRGLWDSTLDPGQAFPRRFGKVGKFRYFCKFHDGMTERIKVVA
ncbi:MAG: cupredoxin domain-containing protein, partial [Acidimicrobiia bacterium]